MPAQPHISLVATSRNDDHGGSMLYRMQHFIDGYVFQFNKFNVPSELIIVDWNPPADRPPLSEVLKIPAQLGCCEIRFITFPREMHEELPHGEALPLFQMIAKNVGIRRARGELIAATNIDILFSDAIMQELRKDLPSGYFYRADRHDAPHELPDTKDYSQILEFCSREKFRMNKLDGTYTKIDGRWILTQPIGKLLLTDNDIAPDYSPHHYYHGLRSLYSKMTAKIVGLLNSDFKKLFTRPERYMQLMTGAVRYLKQILKALVRLGLSLFQKVFSAFRKNSLTLHLHTNACGDFTMLTRDDWFLLRGYLEWPIFSWNLDSILLYQAYFNNIHQRLLPEAPHYHIEHSKGSGYTPEGADTLFKRIEAKGIPYMDWPEFLAEIKKMYEQSKQKQPIQYNDENWGYASSQLTEVTFKD